MLQIRPYQAQKTERGEKRKFEFQSVIHGKALTYLTTDSDVTNRVGIEVWKNNFSTYFDLHNPDETLLGTIGFSIAGISLFDQGLGNRRDFFLDRNEDEYQRIEKLERKIRTGQELCLDDNEFLVSLWEKYTAIDVKIS